MTVDAFYRSSKVQVLSDLVILYGAMRSGTTMFRLILGAHEGLHDIGENRYLFMHVRKNASGQWTYDREALRLDRVARMRGVKIPSELDGRDALADIVGQLAARGEGRPVITLHNDVARFRELVPEAPIIHLVRDPRDVARSSIGMGWAGNTYFGVDHWIKSEREWDDPSLKDARVLTLHYEDLLADIQGNLKQVCEFMDLNYSDAMLDYSKYTSYDSPDPKLAAQWKTKLSAGEVALIEGKVGSLLEARGYVPSGIPPRTPSELERRRLWLDSAVYRWRKGIELYGPSLFLAEQASRRLGLKNINERAKLKMHDMLNASLK